MFVCNTPFCRQVFQESVCHCLQKYCLNYSAALLYLDNLKLREDFGIYVKVGGGVGGWLSLRMAAKLCA